MRTVAVIWLFFERNKAESFSPRSAHPALPREVQVNIVHRLPGREIGEEEFGRAHRSVEGWRSPPCRAFPSRSGTSSSGRPPFIESLRRDAFELLRGSGESEQ